MHQHQQQQPQQQQSQQQQHHQQQQHQSNLNDAQFSSWYPYPYGQQATRDNFTNSLITYSENNNVVGIS